MSQRRGSTNLRDAKIRPKEYITSDADRSGFPLNSIWLKLPDSPGTLWLGDSSSNIHGSSPCSNLRITSGLGMQNPVNDNYMTWDKLDECQGLWYTVLKEYTIKKKAHLILLWGRGQHILSGTQKE